MFIDDWDRQCYTYSLHSLFCLMSAVCSTNENLCTYIMWLLLALILMIFFFFTYWKYEYIMAIKYLDLFSGGVQFESWPTKSWMRFLCLFPQSPTWVTDSYVQFKNWNLSSWLFIITFIFYLIHHNPSSCHSFIK